MMRSTRAAVGVQRWPCLVLPILLIDGEDRGAWPLQANRPNSHVLFAILICYTNVRYTNSVIIYYSWLSRATFAGARLRALHHVATHFTCDLLSCFFVRPYTVVYRKAYITVPYREHSVSGAYVPPAERKEQYEIRRGVHSFTLV